MFITQELNIITGKLSNAQKLITNSSDDQSIQGNNIQESNQESNTFSEHQIKLLGTYFNS